MRENTILFVKGAEYGFISYGNLSERSNMSLDENGMEYYNRGKM